MTTYSRPGAVNASKMLLEINHVSVDYSASSGTVHALTDVSISLERGQILGLAGESGSGKSTLAYAITRLLHPPAVITGERYCITLVQVIGTSGDDHKGPLHPRPR